MPGTDDTPQQSASASQTPASSGALWGGRFAGGPDELFRALNDSLPIDWRFVQHDITGSIAWAGAIHGAGVLNADEHEQIVDTLHALQSKAAALPTPPIESGAEDVHTWVEMQLTSTLGDLGRKLHTGRSRNDQVATDLRLWIRDELNAVAGDVRAAQLALVDLADRAAGVIMPGYTHLQRAQPVLASHWCLAYVEMLERDVVEIERAAHGDGLCPLGCGALAGTAFAIDRDALAASLGFDGPSANSLDATSDRDPVLRALAALATLGVHLSRFAEDLIIYNSGEFAFIEMDDGVASGSSPMPQKKNPDAAELIRGKAGRLIGAHVAMLTTVKGLPLAYNKDLQEDKAALFDAVDTASLLLAITARIAEGLQFHTERCRAAAAGGYSNATDLADVLVDLGVPFRTAHEQVGKAVRRAIELQTPLEDLPEAELLVICPAIQAGDVERVRTALSLESSIARRAAVGGTAPDRVAEQRRAWRDRLTGSTSEGSAA